MKEKIQINGEAILLRRQLGEDTTSPVDIFPLLASQPDLTVVYYPFRDTISGMCIKDESIRLIAINSTLSKGRQRFTAAHEMYHLFIQKAFQTIICARDLTGPKNALEKEADQFASYFLAPYEALHSFVQKNLDRGKKTLTFEDVVKIEQYFGLSRQATITRLLSEGLLTEITANTMKTNVVQSAQKLGYTSELYLPNPKNMLYSTAGNYIRLANELVQAERISTGKYEEILLDAFREDLVYGDQIMEDHYD